MAAATRATKNITVPAPNMVVGHYVIEGTAPLVIHRFSSKVKTDMKLKMETGKPATSRVQRVAKATDDLYDEARYRSEEGWDGCHAGAFRNAMISACRLVGYRMTLAKLSVFIERDGEDEKEPQIPLVRIWGTPRKQEDIARVETGQPYVTVRAAYHTWRIRLNIRYDADQFTGTDISNLLMRVGEQVGIGEGRPDSKNSAGMGWGLFQILDGDEGISDDPTVDPWDTPTSAAAKKGTRAAAERKEMAG